MTINTNFADIICSTDLNLTNSQEQALERAIIQIFRNNAITPNYTLRRLEISQSEWGTVSLSMTIDNGMPGTVGHIFPINAHLFVGPRGGYTCYDRDGRRTTGRHALIYCAYSTVR